MRIRFPGFAPLTALVLALALAGCGGGSDDDAPEPSATPAPPAPGPSVALPAQATCNLPDFQQALLARVNQARASTRVCGTASYPAVPALTWNSQLFDAALAHATDVANNNYFSHTSLDGRSPGDRATAAGYRWQAIGENIAAGQTNVDVVMDAWLESPGHCANIMSPNFSQIGVACTINNTSTYRRYWAMELGRPR